MTQYGTRGHPCRPFQCVRTYFVSTITLTSSENHPLLLVVPPLCPFHVPCSHQLLKLPSYNFLIWNSLWIPLGLTKILLLIKPNAGATSGVLSFPAPLARIDLLHLASLYSLSLGNLRISGTHLFTSAYTVFFYMCWSCFFPSLSCLL